MVLGFRLGEQFFIDGLNGIEILLGGVRNQENDRKDQLRDGGENKENCVNTCDR